MNFSSSKYLIPNLLTFCRYIVFDDISSFLDFSPSQNFGKYDVTFGPNLTRMQKMDTCTEFLVLEIPYLQLIDSFPSQRARLGRLRADEQGGESRNRRRRRRGKESPRRRLHLLHLPLPPTPRRRSQRRLPKLPEDAVRQHLLHQSHHLHRRLFVEVLVN